MQRRLTYHHLAELINALQDASIESVAAQFAIPLAELETLPERLQRANLHEIKTHGLLLEFDEPEELARQAAQELMDIARTKGLEIYGACVQSSELERLMKQSNETAEKYKDIPPGERPRRPATEPYPPKRKLRKPRGPDLKPRKQRGPARGQVHQ